MSPAAEKKVLAVAVMRDGKVINKLIPGKEPVRLGSGYNNQVVAEEADVPDSMVFLSPGDEPDTWVLRLQGSMNAKIESADGSKLNFADLKDLGIFPQDEDGNYLLNVKYEDQGQVTVDPYTIHFGFIKPPKAKPKPKPKPKPKAKKEKPEAPKKKAAEDLALKVIVEKPGEKKREIFPNAGIMTIGTAEYNTVSIKGADLPRIHTLLEPKDGKYMMRLPEGLGGGVEVKGTIVPFSTLIDRNLLKQEKPGEPYEWEMDRNVSGMFKAGDTEIFFSFAPPPKEARPKPEPKPKEIPKKKYKPSRYEWKKFAVRPHDGIVFKGQKGEIDRMQVVLGVGLAIALLVGAVLDRLVVVTEVSKSEMLRRAPTARVASLAETPEPEATGVGEEVIADMPTGEEVEVASGGGGGGPAGGGGEGPAGASAGAEAADQVMSSIGFAAYGTGASGGGAGIVTDLQSAASSGLGLASGEAGQAMVAGAEGGGSGGISSVVGSGGGVASSAETVSQSEVEAVHRAAQVSFSASGSGEALDLGYRDLTNIRRRVNVIKMRVQTAYESLLRSNPTAGGRITLAFSITPSGSVTGVSVNAPGGLSTLTPTIEAAISSVNFGPAPEQTENLPMQVSFNLVPPE
jgi:hypothetical protein